MERHLTALFVVAMMLLVSAVPAVADDGDEAQVVASESSVAKDPILLLAQVGSWGGGAGPRQRDCNRVCETVQVNCQRGCFALPEIEGQNSCSRQCLVTYVECADGCNTRTSQLELELRKLERAAEPKPSR